MKTIGSEFDLPLSHLFWKRKNSIDKSAIKLSSGRCALTFIIQELKLNEKSEVLLPEYLCPEMLEPFEKYNIKLKFYKIYGNLKVNLKDLNEKMGRNTKLVLVIHYFGFPQEIDKIKKICSNKGVILVEDCAQSLLTSYKGKNLGEYGDFSFNSLRKWMAIPDGSIVYKNYGYIKHTYKKSFKHTKYVAKRYFLLIARSILQYTFYNLFKGLDRLQYPKPAAMSVISHFIFSGVNLGLIKYRRTKNFIFLVKNLKNDKIKLLFHSLPKGVCPSGFPLTTKQRDSLKEYLIKHQIYPPIHWQLPTKYSISSEAWELSRHILTIPIDQRYTLDDMHYVVGVLNEYGHAKD